MAKRPSPVKVPADVPALVNAAPPTSMSWPDLLWRVVTRPAIVAALVTSVLITYGLLRFNGIDPVARTLANWRTETADAAPASALTTDDAVPEVLVAGDSETRDPVRAASWRTHRHQELERFVGDWRITGEAYPAQNGPPIKYSGMEKAMLMFGGRFVHQQSHLTVDEQSITQLNMYGYDVVREQYTATGMDSLTTSIDTLTGTMPATGHWIFRKKVPDPVTRTDIDFEIRIAFVDRNTFTYESWLVAVTPPLRTRREVHTRIQ
jgi:hypothetical protein